MEPSRIVAWRVEQRRNAIVATARRLFLHEGYQNTSMDAVAQGAHVSKTSVYKNFASKSELLLAVCDAQSRLTMKALFDAIDRDGELEPMLMELARRLITVLASDDLIAFHRLVIAEVATFPALGPAAYEYGIRRCTEHVEDLFREPLARGKLKGGSAAALAAQFLVLWLGRSYWQRLFGIAGPVGKNEISQDAARTVATFLAAFATPANKSTGHP